MKVGGAEIMKMIAKDLKDENEPFRKMTMELPGVYYYSNIPEGWSVLRGVISQRERLLKSDYD